MFMGLEQFSTLSWWLRHWKLVTGNRNEHFSTNIHPLKYIKGYMGQLYPYFTKWDKNIVRIIHIYGARGIFLLFKMTKTLYLSNGKYKWAPFK